MHFRVTSTRMIFLLAIVIIGSAASFPERPAFRNLKVLPQDISERTLDSLMDTYNRALKVNCSFCHEKATNLLGLPGKEDELDFAKDGPMKDEARSMMRMTMQLNQQYFSHDGTRHPIYLNVVTCNTCHRGNPYPAHE